MYKPSLLCFWKISGVRLDFIIASSSMMREQTCRMHDQDHGISVWFNDSILTEDLSTNNGEIPMGYIDG